MEQLQEVFGGFQDRDWAATQPEGLRPLPSPLHPGRLALRWTKQSQAFAFINLLGVAAEQNLPPHSPALRRRSPRHLIATLLKKPWLLGNSPEKWKERVAERADDSAGGPCLWSSRWN